MEEEVYQVTSSNGDLYLNRFGRVLRQETTEDCEQIIWFDLAEYKRIWDVETVPAEIDILDLRGVFDDGDELVWGDYKQRRAEVYAR